MRLQDLTPVRPLVDNERYTLNEAVTYLRHSPWLLAQRIRAGEIKTIKEGKRVYVPGSELLRMTTLSADNVSAPLVREAQPQRQRTKKPATQRVRRRPQRVA
jgi:hypothetical protein